MHNIHYTKQHHLRVVSNQERFRDWPDKLKSITELRHRSNQLSYKWVLHPAKCIRTNDGRTICILERLERTNELSI